MGFISIQHGHGIACPSYRVTPIRTGAEQALINRTSDMFGGTAKQAGKVISVTADGIVVEYEDGTREGFQLGRRYGVSGSANYPHDLVTTLKAGQKFDVGEVLFYNENFFAPDFLNPGGVAWKAGLPTMIGLLESIATYEDSSAITKEISEQLTTQVTHPVSVPVQFDQAVHRVVKPGTQVNSDDVLCVIEDASTVGSGLIDTAALDTLRDLAANNQRAGKAGRVERIEVFYNGDIEDMSETLQQLVATSDARIAKECKARGEPVVTGYHDEGFRVRGNPLMPDTLVIRFYITSIVPMGNGDKIVVGNQLKSIVGEVLDYTPVSESGIELGCLFGTKSVGKRIVGSANKVGILNILTRIAAKRIIDAYKSGL